MNVFFRNLVLIPPLVFFGLSGGRADEELAAVEKQFSFDSIQRQIYRLKFAARPDEKRFQIMRLPSAKWPKRENFYVKLGEKSGDGQFRVESIVEKEAKTKEGIEVDLSELEIVYLPDRTHHTLVKGLKVDIPTRFAELVVAGGDGKRFFVKEGDAFERSEFPGFQFTLVKVTGDAAVIKATKSGGAEEEFTVRKKTKR